MSDTGAIGFIGGTPVVTVGAGNPEALKYGKMWALDEYRRNAPGENLAQVFLSIAKPRPGADLVDFGCGTGRGSLMLAILGSLRVTMVDFVNNCLDSDIRDMLTTQAHVMRFVKADLETGPLPIGEYGYCTDVMEHIPIDKVNVVLNNILRATKNVFFSIAAFEDKCGALIGEQLHMTVKPYEWWLERFKERDCVILWSQSDGETSFFYVSAWSNGPDLVKAGKLNVTEETIIANVKTNIAGGWGQAIPHPTNDQEVLILGGGPSLAEYESQIRMQRESGAKLITLNGAYNWALEHGLRPSGTVIVDSRPFNARFVKPVIPDCWYFMASQVDPSVLAGLPFEKTLLWHSDTERIKDLLDAQYPVWFPIPGGSTVLLRAIPLLRMLGFRKFHLYGCDSCVANDSHHAYAQPENDASVPIPVVVTADGDFGIASEGMKNGRIFLCHPWMISQAQEMMDLIKVIGSEIELEIYGDGLLAHILNLAASAVGEA